MASKRTLPWTICFRFQNCYQSLSRPKSKKQYLFLNFTTKWLKKMFLRYLELFRTYFAFKRAKFNFSWVNSKNIDLRINKSKTYVWILEACSAAKSAISKVYLMFYYNMESPHLRSRRSSTCFLNSRCKTDEILFIRK